MKDSEGTRLDKFLSARTACSRRASAEAVRAGRVAVDGAVVTEPGLRIDPEGATVTLDDIAVAAANAALRTIALNKPRGYICSTASGQGKTVYDLLPDLERRLVPAGRLDKNSEGLLLLSNDGELVNAVTHPRFGCSKTYRVTVDGPVTEPALKQLRSPIQIDGYWTVPAGASVLRRADSGRVVLEFTLREGRNRQIRRLCEAAGLNVRRLVRTAVRDITLTGLKPGQWRELTAEETERLKRPAHGL